MSLIKQDTIDRIYEAADVVAVAQQLGLDLKRAGGNYKCKSPWHDEKTASMMISPAKQIFKDFSSGKGGGPMKLLSELRPEMTFPERVQWMAELCNVAVEYAEDETPAQTEKRAEKDELMKVLEASKRQFVKAYMELDRTHPAKRYAESRFTAEQIVQWQIGWAPDQWRFIADMASENGAIKTAVSAGVVSEKNGKYFDFFRGRLMFPIMNREDRAVSFGARVVPGFVSELDKDAKEGPKYLNGRETDVYRKDAVLFGINYAAKAIRDRGFAFLVEGYTDTISMHGHGCENTVATCGTALTEEHCKLLKRHCNKLVVIRDGDKAGLAAAERDVLMLMKHELQTDVVELPAGEDPDSFAKGFESEGELETEEAS